jgi:hypothetical protein
MVPSKDPSSSPSSVPSVSSEPSQNPSLQPSYDPDNKSNVGGLVVDILGQSGKMNLDNNNRTVQITMDALREVNANGDVVGNTSSVKHIVQTFASQEFIFGIRDYYTTLFTFNSTTNDTVAEAANGLRVDFSSTLATGSQLKVQALLVSDGGIAGDAQGNWTVSPGDFKWNIWFENWVWHEDAAYVELDIEVKGANGAPSQSNGNMTYDLGDDATLDLRSDYELSDGTPATMPDGYPSIVTSGSKTVFTFKFGRHDSLDIKYDPLISFAAISDPPSASPSMAPTPQSYLACRTRKAMKRKKVCQRIPGCFWKNRKCHPITPAPTGVPTTSMAPSSSPKPTSAGTPNSWAACTTRRVNKRKKLCVKTPGCVWNKRRPRWKKCRHKDSF